MVPTGAPACTVGGGGAGRGGGALYTGRGPVCGTIMRGAGVCGAAATGGAAGRGVLGATGAAGDAEAAIDGVAGADGVTTAAGGGAGRGDGATTVGGAGGTGTAGFSAAGGTIAGRAAIAGVCGAETGACGADVAAGTAGFAGGATTVGLGGAGGGAGRGGGAAAASFFWVMAFSTSPGREMCDRSILVFISSSPRSVRAARADDCASDEPRMWARTFSASCSSSELEWVFFSVTPTRGSASRMALLLTSSSLARSLIRTLLIRPFFSPRCARSSSQPHGVSFLDSHAIELECACHDYSIFS